MNRPTKIWDKGQTTHPEAERFTVGNDRMWDLRLARWDVLGSMAHVLMLESVGLLTQGETRLLITELKAILKQIDAGEFTISESVEDVHSQVESLLTEKLGDTGKKIHSGRSRNDQVLVDLKLYFRHEIEAIAVLAEALFRLFVQQAEKNKAHLLPGYTHLQVAMPSSFGLWLGAYAECLAEDMAALLAAWKICNKNPLGSAAGYGSSFPLNRTLTTQLLGFDSLHYNVVNAQMSRGRTEKALANALAAIAATIGKWAMDCTLYLNQQFGFISFPDSLTTGSSIMPHKKNPDVLEIIRATCNKIQAVPNQVSLLTGNLPSGYHRDNQLLKDLIFPAIDQLKEVLNMAQLMLTHLEVKENLMQQEVYKFAFSVERVNQLVLEGMPFRDAYKHVGKEIESGIFEAPDSVQHTHEGSMGNLCLQEIIAAFETTVAQFRFEKVEASMAKLIAI
jgi:argininosuccinate lyase